MAGRASGLSTAVRRVLPLLLALACGLVVLALPAGAAQSDATPAAIQADESVLTTDAPAVAGPVAINVDEGVSPADASSAAGPASIGSDEPVVTSDAASVVPPASIAAGEPVSVGDAVSVVPPASVSGAEPVAVGDAVSIVVPASIPAAETANVSDAVSIAVLTSPTTTAVTAGPDPGLAGTPVQLHASVTTGSAAVRSGAVTFEDGSTPLGPAVPVDAGGQATLTVSNLALGTHTITAAYGGTPVFDASSGTTTEGIYDYTVAAGPAQTVLRGGSASYGVTLSLADGSTTAGLPASVPFSVSLLPSDASSNAPAAVSFPQSAGSPTTLTVAVQTGALTLGDFSLLFRADARSASAGLHLFDYALTLAPATQTVQRGATASFTLTSALSLGSSSVGLPASIALTTSPGATAGPLALPGSTTVTVATDASTPPGAQPVSVSGDPGPRTASATLYVNVPPVPSSGGPYTANEGAALTLHGSATDSAGETLTYSWDLGSGLGATGASPTVVAPDGPATQAVKLTVCDDHGACATDTTTLTTVNVPPTARLQAPASTPEGSATTVSLTGATDPSAADVAAGLHFAFSCDGSSLAGATYASTSPAASAVCHYADGPSTVTVRARVIDKDGGFTELAQAVQVTNVAPAVKILAPVDGSAFRAGSHVSLSGSFTDPGTLDTHHGTWTVGGTTIPATIVEHGGSGTASATWTPAAAGFYPLSLTVVDKDGGSTTVGGGTLVVFDKRAGSVRGAGALLDAGRDPVLFAFEAAYRGDDPTPDGAVELHVPHLNLFATQLDWLVVTAPSFELRGSGRVNGTKGYGFRLGAVTGRPDQLRVRIWSPGGALLYDSTLRPLRVGNISIDR